MSRKAIYYWKCDRASAFAPRPESDRGEMEALLLPAIRRHLDDGSARLEPFASPGNHLTWRVRHEGGSRLSFLRVEDGPERDDYIAVESCLLDRVRSERAPTPQVVACDASRETVPFAWQMIEYIDQPNLQHWHKRGELDRKTIATQIGQAIADFQGVPVEDFGPFQTSELRKTGELRGYQASYPDYFFLHLESHLETLVNGGLLNAQECDRAQRLCREHASLLERKRSVLVHKDTALWNLLGTRAQLKAIIDWDDAIGGDPVDDLALLGCFFDRSFLHEVLAGYETVRQRPDNFEPRFWLHVLRNLIFKAVIRLRGGYFDKGEDFFLIDSGNTGASLREETRTRLLDAMAALEIAPTSMLYL